MKIIENRLENILIEDNLCIALGTFDGIHYGHRKIIQKAVDTAKEKKCKSAVLTFDNHPFTVIKPEKSVKLITDNNVKADIIRKLGVNYLIFAKFDEEFADIDAKEFIKLLGQNLKARVLICGYNYTFGKFGKGDIHLLSKCREVYKYDLDVIKRVTYKNHMVSSSIIRKKIESGKIEEANALLGYNLYCLGSVSKGKSLGKKLGFPTANIKISQNLCLKNGVYITLTHLDGRVYPSISNVGFNPTVGNNQRGVETFLLDFDGDLYNKELKIEFLEFIREEKKFETIEALKDRVHRDIETAKYHFSSKDVYIME